MKETKMLVRASQITWQLILWSRNNRVSKTSKISAQTLSEYGQCLVNSSSSRQILPRKCKVRLTAWIHWCLKAPWISLVTKISGNLVSFWIKESVLQLILFIKMTCLHSSLGYLSSKSGIWQRQIGASMSNWSCCLYIWLYWLQPSSRWRNLMILSSSNVLTIRSSQP